MTRTWVLAALVAFAACGGANPPPPVAAADRPRPAPASARARTPPPDSHDLEADERLGGHTLQRHVGRSDADLAERLRRERGISAASTYTDEATADAVVGAALRDSESKIDAWEARRGARPNLVLHYTDRSGPPIGRSLARGARTPEPCHNALVVLRWDDRRQVSYVLTSYPEADR